MNFNCIYEMIIKLIKMENLKFIYKMKYTNYFLKYSKLVDDDHAN